MKNKKKPQIVCQSSCNISSHRWSHFIEKMKNNFFNLCDVSEFEQAIFHCQLAESLGLIRRCFLCSNYDHKIIRIPECTDSCSCRQLNSQPERITHYCLKLFEAIDCREGENKNIFIMHLGFTQDIQGFNQIFAEYVIPVESTLTFTLETIMFTSFHSKFQNRTEIPFWNWVLIFITSGRTLFYCANSTQIKNFHIYFCLYWYFKMILIIVKQRNDLWKWFLIIVNQRGSNLRFLPEIFCCWWTTWARS